MSLPAHSRLRASEYLALERGADRRHELVDGEPTALAGASLSHNRITGNLFSALRPQLDDGRCEVFGNDLEVHVPSTGLFAYPDLSVVCGPPELFDQHQDVVLNPRLLIEVLSPSTEALDRGSKFAQYRALGSLAGYLLVSQDRVALEHYGRSGDFWTLRVVERLGDLLELPEIAATLDPSEVYQRVF